MHYSFQKKINKTLNKADLPEWPESDGLAHVFKNEKKPAEAPKVEVPKKES